MTGTIKSIFTAAALMIPAAPATAIAGANDDPVVSGQLKTWHRVTVTFTGPETGETAEPNPFRDYRLDVTFTKGDSKYTVPGFYVADGDAAESGAAEGNKWRVHFAPDETGQWRWRASFRTGKDIAAGGNTHDGQATAFDGASGTFTVEPSDKTTPDCRQSGMLRYVGEHYLQFAGSGKFFLKSGADSPENFLAYADFDGTYSAKQAKEARKGEALPKDLHRYQPHAGDWNEGDPTWQGGKGKNIVGALNYLASKGVNSVYFLTMNVGGDGRDVWPWIDPETQDRFDCSKLDQWEIVFSHMDNLGIMLHVITQETENDQLINQGALGVERKLYYRELVARFAHHPAVVWNMGEENTNTDEQRKAFSRYINQLDPYGHPIVVHTFPGKYDEVYTPLLDYPYFHGPSLQMGNMKATYAETVKWVKRSAESGRKWIVSLDEIGPAHTGVKPDADDPDHDDVRKHPLWGNLMGGGAGCEWYFGYEFAHNDLNLEDWRSREKMWDQTRFAVEFFQTHLPFDRMLPGDELTSDDDSYCFAKPGEVYAVYLPDGGTTDLTLAAGRYTVKWYNPRSGGPLVDGTIRAISGPGPRSVGDPPVDRSQDWAVLVRTVQQ